MLYPKKLLILSVLLLCCGYSFSQFRATDNKVIGVDVFKGFIFRHKPQIAHLITAHPIGFRVTLDGKTYGRARWQQRYNFPDVGMTFTYVDYRNDVLGRTLALIPHYAFYINKNNASKNQLRFKIGLGLAYNTEKYDREFNNKNTVLSTDFSIAVLFELAYQRELTKRLLLNFSLGMTHFSNGAIKRPNSGINVISPNLGMSYMINYQPMDYKYVDEAPLAEKKIGYTLTLSSGVHEYARIGTGQYPFLVVSGLVDKQLNHKSVVGAGLEWFGSFSMKKDIADRYRFSDEETPNWHRIGAVLSHELIINEMSIITQAGYYLYDEFNYYGKLYLRIGLRKYFNDKIFGSLSVKSHAAKAEAAEFAIGWRIK